MSGRLQERIRQALRDVPDGMTARELMVHLGMPPLSTQVFLSLRRMPDVYIDRWQQYPLAAVYVAVEVPPNCPKPEKRNARS